MKRTKPLSLTTVRLRTFVLASFVGTRAARRALAAKLHEVHSR
jgi:hypothetical protein